MSVKTLRETKHEFIILKEMITKNFIEYTLFTEKWGEIWKEDILTIESEKLEKKFRRRNM